MHDKELSCLCANVVVQLQHALDHWSLLFSRDRSSHSFCPSKKLGIRQGKALADMISTGCVMLCLSESQGAHSALVVSF
jgi:hypothetical protein